MKPSVLILASLITAGSLGSGIADKQSSVLGCPSCPDSDLSAGSTNTSAIKESSEATFKSDVLTAKQPVLVDFYASWCGPCKRMAPIVENVSKSYGGKIVVVKVNVDKNPKLSAQYDIQSIPALKLFKNGKVVGEAVGVTSLAELRDKIDRAI
ncbi:MAG: thioredoxin [Candidatus Melainabacteria bacterium]|nr:thioredoxin [Candidatus Melainabacteria bacterium]